MSLNGSALEYSDKSKKANQPTQRRSMLSYRQISAYDTAPERSSSNRKNRSSSQNCKEKSDSSQCHVWNRIKCFIVDEIDQIIKYKTWIHRYFSSGWNWLDLAGIICYLIAFITRFFVVESIFAASKILMSIDFIIWCIRLLYFCSVYEALGPKLVMIYKMMKDTFLIFVCFILVFLLAFSITSWSLLSTNKQINWLYATNGSSNNFTLASENGVEWSWQLLRDVFNWGIWKVFGQVAEPFKNNATDMDVISENDAYGTFVFLYAVAFVVISNVLLLNVLIAMFNERIGEVLKGSHTWIHRSFGKTNLLSKSDLEPDFVYLCD
ncbi:unnamed protein product [Rotaria sordida]|uniref:Ion transport domain-containing protein n=1 Tax=Rotaria sordida TaxID=392033 RepID=A0A814VV42_9BILA|nr:unnamed protein product [Rotaria sordida]CAF1456165.1 unnamed protein product [Rotaria sordida]